MMRVLDIASYSFTANITCCANKIGVGPTASNSKFKNLGGVSGWGRN
jgi:hypothetical protein